MPDHYAARFSVTMGRCFRLPCQLTTSSSFAPGLPRTVAGGAAQPELTGQWGRGSQRGLRQAAGILRYRSSGVRPPSQE